MSGERIEPANFAETVRRELADADRQGLVERLWRRDATLWSADEGARPGIAAALGWLDVPLRMEAEVPALLRFAAEVKHEGVRDVLLCGMGGSSLAPYVFGETLGSAPGFPRLEVLDSTDPAAVVSAARRHDPATTLFIVASKSGSTLEPNILFEYFFGAAAATLGDAAGGRFVVITDPGSPLEKFAARRRVRRVFSGDREIGGRFSALSAFGLLPAALIGCDLVGFLSRARAMVKQCAAEVPVAQNPGALLGAWMAACAAAGRDKLTLLASDGLAQFPLWIEQLVAESTGKNGKGILPVAGEVPGDPALYGQDRAFACLRLAGSHDGEFDGQVRAIAAAGHPAIILDIADRLDLGAEMYRWEFATAYAGARLGINAFDQPNVQESKTATEEILAAGSRPSLAPVAERDGMALYADAATLERLGGGADFDALLAAHVASAGRGDYFAINAFVESNLEHAEILQGARLAVRAARRTATTLGFGPRFLHSTGQYHKGGPNTGVFLQVTAAAGERLAIPGASYSFGDVIAAQAEGDLRALVARGRRAMRVHLLAGTEAGLRTLAAALEKAAARESAAAS